MTYSPPCRKRPISLPHSQQNLSPTSDLPHPAQRETDTAVHKTNEGCRNITVLPHLDWLPAYCAGSTSPESWRLISSSNAVQHSYMTCTYFQTMADSWFTLCLHFRDLHTCIILVRWKVNYVLHVNCMQIEYVCICF